MQFVDDGVAQRRVRRAVLLPIEVGIDHHGLGHPIGVIAVIARQVRVGPADLVGIDRLGPVNQSANRQRLGIEQQLGRVEAEAVRGVPRPIHAKPVELAGLDAPQIAMMHKSRGLAQLDSLGLLTAAIVIQAELDLGGVL